MIKSGSFETLLSGTIAIFAIGFLLFMRWQTGMGSLSWYELNAVLRQSDRLAVGADVKIAGVTVGKVEELSLEPKTYRVKIRIDIRDDIRIPQDSQLSISQGLTDSSYLIINPGQSRQTVSPGGLLQTRA